MNRPVGDLSLPMSAGDQRPLNALSVDVEDWFQVGAFEGVIDRGSWESLPTRVEANTDRVLALFAQAEVTGTFFTLGWVADRFPELMRRIVAAGHEVASHGYDHRRVFLMDAASFRADLLRTETAIRNACGVRPRGYRAPSFSIDARTPWAHEVLAELGYQYSSSVAPIAHDHYGWRSAPRFGFRPIAGSDLIELPVTTIEVAGRRMAAGGGGFFRLLPYAFSRWALRRVNSEGSRPGIFYFHPWEIDPEQPRVAGASVRSRLRHYSRLGAMAGKLRAVLRDFRWTTTSAVAAIEKARLP